MALNTFLLCFSKLNKRTGTQLIPLMVSENAHSFLSDMQRSVCVTGFAFWLLLLSTLFPAIHSLFWLNVLQFIVTTEYMPLELTIIYYLNKITNVFGPNTILIFSIEIIVTFINPLSANPLSLAKIGWRQYRVSCAVPHYLKKKDCNNYKYGFQSK